MCLNPSGVSPSFCLHGLLVHIARLCFDVPLLSFTFFVLQVFLLTLLFLAIISRTSRGICFTYLLFIGTSCCAFLYSFVDIFLNLSNLFCMFFFHSLCHFLLRRTWSVVPSCSRFPNSAFFLSPVVRASLWSLCPLYG